MVSDQEIARGVEILVLRDPTGLNQHGAVQSVVQQLSHQLGIDLSHKTPFIAEHINLLRHHLLSRNHPVGPPPPPPTGNDHLALQQQQQHQQWLQQCYLQQQQQQQQRLQHGLQSPPFTLNFGGGEYAHVSSGGGSHVTSPRSQQHKHVTVAVTPAAATTVVKNGAKASKDSTQTVTKKRGGSGGLNKLCGVSPQLQPIVGEAVMARTEIVRQLWVYIRKNNLQDPSNKRKIVCDEALRAVLETDSTDMFKMNKLLAKHILPLDPSKVSVPSKRQKLDVEDGLLPPETVVAVETDKTSEPIEPVESDKATEPVDPIERVESVGPVEPVESGGAVEPVESVSPVEPVVSVGPVEPVEPVVSVGPVEPVESVKPAETNGVPPVVTISDALADFLGTTRREMPASEAIQHVYEYVKVNSLEDTNSMTVSCDEKLKQLLGCERITSLEIKEILARHHLLQ